MAKLSEQLGDLSQKMEKHAKQSTNQMIFLSGKLRILSSSLQGAAQSQSASAFSQLWDIHSAASEATETLIIVQILAHLHFPTMRERFANVSGPAQGTFDWIFEDSEAFLQNSLPLTSPSGTG